MLLGTPFLPTRQRFSESLSQGGVKHSRQKCTGVSPRVLTRDTDSIVSVHLPLCFSVYSLSWPRSPQHPLSADQLSPPDRESLVTYISFMELQPMKQTHKQTLQPGVYLPLQVTLLGTAGVWFLKDYSTSYWSYVNGVGWEGQLPEGDGAGDLMTLQSDPVMFPAVRIVGILSLLSDLFRCPRCKF